MPHTATNTDSQNEVLDALKQELIALTHYNGWAIEEPQRKMFSLKHGRSRVLRIFATNTLEEASSDYPYIQWLMHSLDRDKGKKDEIRYDLETLSDGSIALRLTPEAAKKWIKVLKSPESVAKGVSGLMGLTGLYRAGPANSSAAPLPSSTMPLTNNDKSKWFLRVTGTGSTTGNLNSLSGAVLFGDDSELSEESSLFPPTSSQQPITQDEIDIEKETIEFLLKSFNLTKGANWRVNIVGERRCLSSSIPYLNAVSLKDELDRINVEASLKMPEGEFGDDLNRPVILDVPITTETFEKISSIVERLRDSARSPSPTQAR